PDFEFLRRYSAADGLQGNKFNFGASFSDGDGFLYFGGSRGYNRFHPSRIPSSTSPPSIRIIGINVSDTKSRTTTNSGDIESILLNHEDLFITFEFSALDYADPESTSYRHKLIGFDTDWVDIGSRGSATYTSLPPGEYVFRVQAVNSAGIWNYDGLTIGLEVMPAPWRTWWAYTLYLIAALVALAWAFRYQRNNVLRDQQLVHAQEMQRIADRVADDLQDQIEVQTKLSSSMHYYNKQLLYWTKFCTDTTVEYEPADTVLAHERIRFRLDVLELIQDSLYYRGEQLYVQLPSFVTSLVHELCSNHPELGSRLTSINDVKSDLVPAARAIPIAIIFAELFDNSLKHALPGKGANCFVRFSLTINPDMSSRSDQYKLVYQDDGDGIPTGLSFESPESAGFAIIRHAAASLGCEMAISDEDRRLVSASFDLPW
ncbi:MAG: triple tyrosine motif-containing protein, partial [Haliea sp.]